MISRHTILLKIISIIITFYLLYLIISVLIYNDYLNSIVPGWHKTVYSMGEVLRISILVGFSAILTYFLYTLILRLLMFLWLKAYPVSNTHRKKV
ncbi:MAG: hypothetical protein JWR02_1389 [Mucilaginibacter sp.]|nr:hypothetical protein [Mucilaginibacter sp.]